MAFLVGGFYFFREKKDLLLSFPLFQKAYADYLLEGGAHNIYNNFEFEFKAVKSDIRFKRCKKLFVI